jgi:hypothetical protein
MEDWNLLCRLLGTPVPLVEYPTVVPSVKGLTSVFPGPSEQLR